MNQTLGPCIYLKTYLSARLRPQSEGLASITVDGNNLWNCAVVPLCEGLVPCLMTVGQHSGFALLRLLLHHGCYLNAVQAKPPTGETR